VLSSGSCAAPASSQGGPDGGQVRLPLARAGGKRGGSIGHGPLGGQPAAVVDGRGGQLGGVRRPCGARGLLSIHIWVRLPWRDVLGVLCGALTG